MTPDEVIRYFGSQRLAADALDVTFKAVSAWKARGFIPWLRQNAIQNITGGRLVARREDLVVRVAPVNGVPSAAIDAGDGQKAASGDRGLEPR